MKASSLIVPGWLLLLPLLLAAPVLAAPEDSDAEQSSSTVLQSFTESKAAPSEEVSIDDRTKRIVMFVMGVPLLLLLIVTAALGIAMGVYGKPLFVPHMICAGLSLTLAIAHAVVGIVWFYPF